MKDTRAIIRDHRAFFEGLAEIDQVVVVGHSASPVDWDYFKEVADAALGARWFFGTHGLRDLANVSNLAEVIGLRDFAIFRTDGIRVRPLPATAPWQSASPKPKVFVGKRLSAVATGPNLRIVQGESVLLEMGLPDAVRSAVFIGEHLMVLLVGRGDVLLFGNDYGRWAFIDCLAPIRNQRLVNPRLRHVYVTGSDVSFVYNNRVRSYDLASGKLLRNEQVRNAGSKRLAGVDVLNDLTSTAAQRVRK